MFFLAPCLSLQKPREKREAGPAGASPALEEEKTQKPTRRQRVVEEVGVELVVLDLPDLSEDELVRSAQK